MPHSPELSRHAVVHDRWDKRNIDKAKEILPRFEKDQKRLRDNTGTGAEALEDLFGLFRHATPKPVPDDEVHPDWLINKVIEEEIRNAPDFERIRQLSVGDTVESGLSSLAFASEIEEQAIRLHEKTEQERQEIEDIEEQIREEQGEPGEPGEGEPGDGPPGLEGQPGPGDQPGEGKGNLPDLLDQLEAARERLKDKLDGERLNVNAAMQAPAKEAADSAKEHKEAARAWGLELPDLQRMNPEDRFKAAQIFDNSKFQEYAKMFGVLDNVRFTEKQNRDVIVPEEIMDVEMGDNLGRLVPGELINFHRNPDDFVRRMMEGQLHQYHLEGNEMKGKGGMLMLTDSSGSMNGQPDIWAKGLCLESIQIAEEEDRECNIVFFGSIGALQEFRFTEPEDFTFKKRLEVAEYFMNSGTDFQTPMSRALEILNEEHERTGKTEADVVFLTDGCADVTDAFMDRWHSEMDRLDFTCWGVLLHSSDFGWGGEEIMNKITRNNACRVEDILTGKDIRHIFRAL